MPAEYDVVLPPAPASGPTPDTIQACHMKAAARNGDYKLIQLINDTELLCKHSLPSWLSRQGVSRSCRADNVFEDPTESRALGAEQATQERQSLRDMLQSFGREAQAAHLPPSDRLTDGGNYNISECGPEGDEWPLSSGVWVPYRREPTAAHRLPKSDDDGAASASQQAGATCEHVVADGKTPAAAALQDCINSRCQEGPASGSRAVYLPAGSYALDRTITVNASSCGATTIRGDGKATQLLWQSDADLFVWAGGANAVTIASLSIISTTTKSQNSTAVRFESLTQSLIDSVFISATAAGSNVFGSGFDLGQLTDSVTIRETQMWGVTGVGITVGHGSQVIIKGGRIIGNNPFQPGKRATSTGIHVTGNNGGVHIAQTDVIAHLEALRLDNSNGAGSNREIFLAHPTFDSSWRGIAIYDNSVN